MKLEIKETSWKGLMIEKEIWVHGYGKECEKSEARTGYSFFY